MKRTISGWSRHLLLATGYGAGHALWLLSANVFWHPPAGWRFALMALLPIRLWPWPIAAELVVYLLLDFNIQRSQGSVALAILWFLLHRGLALTGPWVWHRTRTSPRLDTPGAMSRLLLAMLLAAFGASCFNVWWLPPLLKGAESQITPSMLFLQLVMGDFIGMLLLVPAAMMLVQSRPDAAILRKWRIDIPLILLPALALYAGIVLHASVLAGFFATTLCALPVMVFAFRSGWRGVALAFTLASCAVAICNSIAGTLQLSIHAQLLMTAIGVSGLLLGAANDELRASRDALAQRNALLASANRGLDKYASELRDAARRNLDLHEDLRRWITSELHDELGQDLTALEARLSLLERRTSATELLQPVWEIIGQMRRAMSGLMSALRPAGLDDFGLRQSLEQGSIRKMVEASGLVYEVVIDDRAGVLDALDDHLQLTLYRSVQESANNTIRHGDASGFKVWLRSHPDDRVILLTSDDGRGFQAGPRSAGVGLQGIRDRVLAAGGRWRVRGDARGARLVLKFNDVSRRR